MAATATITKKTKSSQSPVARARKTASAREALSTPVTQYDLFTQHLKNIQLESVEQKLSEQINGNRIRIDSVEKNLAAQISSANTRTEGLEKNLNTRIDDLDKNSNTRIDGLRDSMNRGFTVLGVALAFVGIGLALLQIFVK